MSFFKKIKKSVKGTVKTVVSKSKDISAIAKLNNEIASMKSHIEYEYYEIGKNAYQANIDGSEDISISESINKIKNLFEQINVKSEEVLIHKGITLCPKCGEELDMVCVFCGKCGAEIKREL